jgi:hypothetical protein
MESKKCFYCRKNLPLVLFNVNNCVYKVKADMNRTVSCRFCSIRRAFKLNGYLNKVDGKFIFIEAGKKEIIKKFLIGK